MAPYFTTSDRVCTDTFSSADTVKISTQKGCKKHLFQSVWHPSPSEDLKYTRRAVWSQEMYLFVFCLNLLLLFRILLQLCADVKKKKKVFWNTLLQLNF